MHTEGFGLETQVTSGSGGRILTNFAVWSPDSQWIVYDTRSDSMGAIFDGQRIEMVHVETGEVRILHRAVNGAHCGVATFSPLREQVVFILGPENPTPDWEYSPAHRQGVLVDIAAPGTVKNLEARALSLPLIPGALRGGTHVHVFSPEGDWVSFTYNDALLTRFIEETDSNDIDLRNIGVSVPESPVSVRRDHPRNHDGEYFSVLVTRTIGRPRPGSDEIRQALEEGWMGAHGYRREDGSWQHRALAFQGEVMGERGEKLWEVFVVDLPEEVTQPSPDGPLEGTLTKRPTPPLGTIQRRLTNTEHRRYPGLQGPRHWLRSSPGGTQIAFLMRDDAGAAQLWTVSPLGGEPRQVTQDSRGVSSAFTWSPDGLRIAYAADNSIFTVEAATGISRRLTPRSSDAPSPLACVFSPDGSKIAFLRRGQIWVVSP